MNGKEAFEVIFRIKPSKALYSSGNTADFIKSRGVDKEGIELIMKPVQPIELLKKIRVMQDAKLLFSNNRKNVYTNIFTPLVFGRGLMYAVGHFISFPHYQFMVMTFFCNYISQVNKRIYIEFLYLHAEPAIFASDYICT